MKVRFDVNDATNRDLFLEAILPQALAGLTSDRRALWGQMTAQQMVEHLLWTFDISVGDAVSPCPVPEEKRRTLRVFLFDNRPTPRGFESPVLKAGLPPLRFGSIEEAIMELRRQVAAFLSQDAAARSVERIHPLFGPLDGEGWSRNHFKHGVHHLQQFDLIEVEPAAPRVVSP